MRLSPRHIIIFAFIAGLIAGGCGAATKYSGNAQDSPDVLASLRDHLGLELGRSWEYKGEGNEFASYTAEVVYATEQRYQVMENNGGTVLARVIELRNDGAYEIFTAGEQYTKTNYLESDTWPAEGMTEEKKLLPWPLTVGSRWVVTTDTTATLMATDAQRTVPLGSFENTVHVQHKRTLAANQGTEPPTTSVTDYYFAPKVGLIETVFHQGETEVTSALANTKPTYESN